MNGYTSPAVQNLFDEVARAYQRTPFEIAIFVFFVGGIVVTMAVYLVIQNRIYRRQARIRAEQAYEAHISRLDLPPSHLDLLQILSKFMKKPHLRYLLFEDENMFDTCAAELLAENGVTPDAISALRVEIGFSRRLDKAPHSSTQIPAGSLVFLLPSPNHKGIPARTLEADPYAFRVRITTRKTPILSPGSTLSVVYHCAAGVFGFQTSVQSRDDRLLSLRHSESLVRSQRRQYYRAPLTLPVTIRPLDGSNRSVVTRFLDLGGNGASAENYGGRFRPGQDLSLSFRPDEKTVISVIARVVRLSKENTVMHLEFRRIQETNRDRIYRALFTPPGGRRTGTT